MLNVDRDVARLRVAVDHAGAARQVRDAALDILDFRGFVLPADDTYILVINSRSSEDGAFDFIVDRVIPSAEITVDDDLAQCPDANTRNLHAALLGAPDGATVNVCDGDYVFSLADLIQTGSSIITAGNTIDAAMWFRDPTGPDGFALSDGIEFILCP